LNLFTVLDQAAARFGDRGALYHGERQLCTWLELRERALCIATTIRAQGTAGARIAVASENRPEIVELMFAIWAAECVLVPINYKLHPREMVQILDDAGASQVFASPKIGAELAPLTDVPIETLDTEGYSRWRASPAALLPTTDSSALAWLFYTSGTTGRSKGAMLTHRNLVANAHQAAAWDPNMRRGEETVARHIKQACERYGVNKRTYLVILTLFDGTLTFSDIFRRRYYPFPE